MSTGNPNNQGGFSLASLQAPRAVSLTGLLDSEGEVRDVRSALAAVSGWGFAGVVLDVTLPGLRPRELDRSARRDIAVQLRRLNLAFAGLDFFIPPSHFADPGHADRAVAAAVAAAELASELAKLTSDALFSMPTVMTDMGASPLSSVCDVIKQTSQRTGAAFADAHWPSKHHFIAVDPAAMIFAGERNLHQTIAGIGIERVAAARLSDVTSLGRVPIGEGSLDVTSYEVILQSIGYKGPLTLDLRGMNIDMQQRAIRTTPGRS